MWTPPFGHWYFVLSKSYASFLFKLTKWISFGAHISFLIDTPTSWGSEWDINLFFWPMNIKNINKRISKLRPYSLDFQIDSPWQDRTEKSSWGISPLLKHTRGCVGCLEIKNFILKMNLVLFSANIDSKWNELQKTLKLHQKRQFYHSIAKY